MKRVWKIYVAVPVFLLAWSGCETDYQVTQEPAKKSVVCDPFNNGTGTSVRSGILASLHYFPKDDPGIANVRGTTDFEPGKPGIQTFDSEIFLSKLDVPLRNWESGFSLTNGELLKMPNGEVLLEWFSLRMVSSLVAPAAQDEGHYQLSTISDDGSTVSVDADGDGTYELLVNNDGVHPERVACADRTVQIKRDRPLKMKINYFQGPRNEISIQLLWRKVSGGAANGLNCTGTGFGIIPAAAFQLQDDRKNPCVGP